MPPKPDHKAITDGTEAKLSQAKKDEKLLPVDYKTDEDNMDSLIEEKMPQYLE